MLNIIQVNILISATVHRSLEKYEGVKKFSCVKLSLRKGLSTPSGGDSGSGSVRYNPLEYIVYIVTLGMGLGLIFKCHPSITIHQHWMMLPLPLILPLPQTLGVGIA